MRMGHRCDRHRLADDDLAAWLGLGKVTGSRESAFQLIVCIGAELSEFLYGSNILRACGLRRAAAEPLLLAYQVCARPQRDRFRRTPGPVRGRRDDYIVFSILQWARLGCPKEVVAKKSALADWRSRMIALYDNLGDRFPGYPAGHPDRS